MAGKLYTPPVSDGLLPGTLRGQLLAEGEVQERSLHLDQLDEVESWYLVNALRGWRTAEFRR
jgi:para-aminobenzoate synthetase/4-amino-4-deoxychorismate lyase